MKYAPKNNGVTARPPTQLLDQVFERLRVLHYSLRTEDAYLSWIRRFILAIGKLHPAQMGQAEVEAFLTRLAIQAQVSAGTQNQALAARLFLSHVSIGITCPTQSLVFKILSRGVTVHNRAVTTPNATNKKTAQCAVFSSDLLPADQGRRASASTSLALGSRSCLVTANGPMLSIGTATITEEITTITAPIMCVSARPSIDSPP